MKEAFFTGKLPFILDELDFISVSRSRGYSTIFTEGRMKSALIYTSSGKMSYKLSGSAEETIIVSSGNAIFIPYKEKYTSSFIYDNTSIKYIQFNIVSGKLPSFFNKPFLISHSAISEYIADLNRTKPIENMFFVSKTYELLWKIYIHHKQIPNRYRMLTPAIHELKQNYFHNEKISYYSGICGMSESNFRRQFNAFTGMSPIKYRNRVRLIEVQKRLNSGEYTVEEAAMDVGFYNMSFFYEAYKNYYGHTPMKGNY